MFRSKTVFVVGAGASNEVNLPTGNDLKGRIAQALDIKFDHWTQMTGDRRIAHFFREYVKLDADRHGNINPLLKKCWQIRDVMPVAAISIDNYIDAHRGDKDLELCGKLGIVKCILDAESSSKLKFKESSERYDLPELQDTWYMSFLRMLTEGVSRDDVGSIFDNLSIITFNYDRCIEHFLPQALADLYNLSLSDMQLLVGKLRIYHPYGQVGPLPWQDRQNGIAYGYNEWADLLVIAEKIKTFTEGMHSGRDLSPIRQFVAQAETIVFLGFAFHAQNLELISPDIPMATRRIFATVKGISHSDEQEIVRDLKRMHISSNIGGSEYKEPKVSLLNDTCNSLFHHFWRSLPAAA